jgi:hypothetical protein
MQTHIDDLACSGAVHLLTLVSTAFNSALSMPAVFDRLKITCCNNTTVHLCSESDYCGILLCSCHLRTSYCTHNFSYQGNVSFHLLTYVGPRSSLQVPLGQNSDVEATAHYIHAQIDKDVLQEGIGNPDLLPWLAQAYLVYPRICQHMLITWKISSCPLNVHISWVKSTMRPTILLLLPATRWQGQHGKFCMILA